MAKDDQKREKILAEMALDLRRVADHLRAIMPQTAEKIDEVFSKKIMALEKPLFPRIND